MPVSAFDFRSALSRFPSGVTVVTTRDSSGRLHGLTVSAFCSVSLEPPLALICIEKATASHYAFVETGIFAVNVLSAGQQTLSERFALPFDDKFDNVEFEVSKLGVPLIAGCIANLECRVTQAYEGGDHTIFVGQVESSRIEHGEPLVYFRSDYRTLSGQGDHRPSAGVNISKRSSSERE
ncbi:MAG TPA: flavin reductase family protein [Pyrinomonadaceae bacterium]|nr:flavin reductase family protein [Pyrinomonadaceae bacterium]HMP63958.1 flavin reductase family protein [Pyrinomonadaceae bacterium]